ncbi:MAG TPA: phenylalanine--tRNA ligase subunit alpha [Candidatus Thermoplasmatota archaeon]|nr:phenylalanine--tRNA ligase subunit alpha [Candidatus Thermoplasmatota archaeon]
MEPRDLELSTQEKKVLLALGQEDRIAPERIVTLAGYTQTVEVMNGVSWLRAKGLVDVAERLRVYYSLDKEGQKRAQDGLPERRVLTLLQNRGALTFDELSASGVVAANEVPIAVGWLKRKGLAEVEDREGRKLVVLTTSGREAHGAMPDEELLQGLLAGEKEETELQEAGFGKGLEWLRQRQKVLKRRETIERTVSLTPRGRALVAAGIELLDEITQITPEVLQSGAWKQTPMRRYDVNAYAPAAAGAKRHPLRRIVDDIRRIFLEMGFTEIEGPFVSTTFHDMDVLFTPQDHPAREMQDTFYLESPARAALPDSKLLRDVRAVHETGGTTGSAGWGYAWRKEEAERLILRTHTTVETVRHLLAHKEPPVKAFVIGRVFRKEAMDATHLPEFHQVDGIVMEEDASLSMLIGLLKEFYRKMGFPQARVRPAFFPYTEPSLEVEVNYHGRWIELGGAGIFRPEVTGPIGLRHPVLAWGLGLERLAMMSYGLKDIRELYVSDVDWLRNAPIAQPPAPDGPQ